MVQRRGISANAVCELLDANGNPFPRLADEPTTVQLPTFDEQPQLVAYAELDDDTVGGAFPFAVPLPTQQVTVRTGYHYLIELVTGTWSTTGALGNDVFQMLVEFASDVEANVNTSMIEGNDWMQQPGDPEPRSQFIRRKITSGLVPGATYTIRASVSHSQPAGADVNLETGVPMSVAIFEVNPT